MKGFKKVRAYVYGKGVITTNIGIDNGFIAYIGDDEKVITEVIPCGENQIVLPGFIDEHIHGANGSDAMDKDLAALSNIADSLAREGTTSFLATTMTMSRSKIADALKTVGGYISENRREGARILGAHLEGPFISEKHIGAQSPDHVLKPDAEILNEFIKASENNVKLITLAPEKEGAHELIEFAEKNNITVSAGHTDSGFIDIKNAIEFGLSCITHTYNAQKPLHHREVGTVGSAFYFDQLYTEIICDLIHVSPPAIKLLIKNKPKDKIILITDSMRAKYLPDGESELGGQTVIVKDGEARLKNGALAGSVLKMNEAIKNLVISCDVKFTDAIDFATVNPAKNLGVFDSIGSISVGKKADFTVMNEDFSIAKTVRDGLTIFEN